MHRRTFVTGLGLGTMAIAASWPARGQAQGGSGPINLTKVGFERRTLETSLGDMAVFTAGEGDPLLLLHGVGAGASSFLWYKLAPILAKQHRVIAPDFVGWGESFRPGRYVLVDDYLKQIGEVGSWIGESVPIVSSSLTSGFLLMAMQQGIIDATKLVFFSPSGGKDFGIEATPEEATAFFRRLRDSPRRDAFYDQEFATKALIENWYKQVGFVDPDAVPDALVNAALYNARQPNSVYSALPFLTGDIRYDIGPLLEQVEAPAMMLWGSEEIQIPAQARTKIEQVNPAIEVVRIENARSSFGVEQPEATLAALSPFLATQNG